MTATDRVASPVLSLLLRLIRHKVLNRHAYLKVVRDNILPVGKISTYRFDEYYVMDIESKVEATSDKLSHVYM